MNKEKDTVKEIHELKQETVFLRSTVDFLTSKVKHAKKKNYTIIIISILVISISISGVSVYASNTIITNQVRIDTPMYSEHIIQELRGDTLLTGYAWDIIKDQTIQVAIVDADKASPEKIQIIKDAILSTKTIELENKLLHKGPGKGTYYLGWKGALEEAARADTKNIIPVNFEIIESDKSGEDITIFLIEGINDTGASGITKTFPEPKSNKISKVWIHLYNIDDISNNGLAGLMRHEFGHALGLFHTEAPEELMNTRIPEYPVITHCSIQSIRELYDGKENREVTCRI